LMKRISHLSNVSISSEPHTSFPPKSRRHKA